METEIEVWKEIPDYDAYEASSLGNIRNKKRNQVMAKYQTKLGYERITLRKNNKYVSVDVHRLVAITFLPNVEDKKTVNHINRKKNDNRVSNLEWATHSEQVHHCKNSDDPSCMDMYKSISKHYIHHDDEEWLPMKDYPMYEISNYGFVRNMKNNYVKIITVDGRGYCYVSIGNKPTLCHRLVAKHFIPNFTTTCIVNHIDGNKTNNHVNNLECVTQSRNILHAYENNMINKTKKIGVLQVNNQGIVVNTFDSLTQAESLTGINRGCIHNAISKNCPSHGYKWYTSYSEYIHDKEHIKNNIFSVYQYDMEGNMLASFGSYGEAEIATGVKKVNINRSINRAKTGIGSAGGFVWANSKTCQENVDKYFHQLSN